MLVLKLQTDLENYHYPKVSEMKELYISRVDVVIGFLQTQDIETANKNINWDDVPVVKL